MHAGMSVGDDDAVRVVVVAVASGLVAGVVLDVLTFLLARYGPQAGNWSFRGNGALVVPLGLGPAVLAAGWTALVLHARGAAAWARIAMLAGAIGVLLVVASAAAVLLFDMLGAMAAQLLILAAWLWSLAAPVLAAIIPIPTRRPAVARLSHALGALLFATATILGFYVAGVLLPPG